MQRCEQTKRCICVYVSCVIHITDKHHPRYVHLNPSVCYPTAILSLFSLRLNTKEQHRNTSISGSAEKSRIHGEVEAAGEGPIRQEAR